MMMARGGFCFLLVAYGILCDVVLGAFNATSKNNVVVYYVSLSSQTHIHSFSQERKKTNTRKITQLYIYLLLK